MNDQEMIAAPLEDILAPLCDGIGKLCECIQSYAQQPGVHPCDSFPFNFSRSIVQTYVCWVATTAFQVPRGMTGVITQIALQERYPGTLYGARFLLVINDNLSPEFPLVDHNVGGSIGDGSSTRICLEEQDMVSILLQCSWTPVVYVGIESTFQQTLFAFNIQGYFQYKEV